MAKVALLVLALVAVAAAKPLGLLGGYGVAQKTAHVSHHVVSPYLGLGYGMLGMGGIGLGGIGHSVASHSVSHHVVPHLGLGMMGLKGIGYYPGGIGLGYGII